MTRDDIHDNARTAAGRCVPILTAAVLAMLFVVAAQPAAAATPCKTSAVKARQACIFDAKDDLYEGKAKCHHISDAGDREECFDEGQEEFLEAKEECIEVFEFRSDFCEDSGEFRYDPEFRAAMFTDTFDNLNPLWPLAPGNWWRLESEEETIVVTVLDATKRIKKAINCIVVNDVVSEGDGPVIEDTDDWYAQAHNGDIYYCGESSKDYEIFEGDDPEEPELVAIDGSFKHGVEGAKAGLLISANPMVGDMYRQEFALGDAEDGAEVLSTTYNYGDKGGLDKHVPQELAELFCSDGDCVVLREFNLQEPDTPLAKKYFSPGVGLFLEVEGNEVVELVACNVDPRCDDL